LKEKPWTESVTHSYFQTYLIGRSTIVTEALVQLTMGGPLPVYNGGLLKVAVRHFDAAAKRPGLSPDVAALVRHIEDDAIDLTLANTNPMDSRRLIVQAGAYPILDPACPNLCEHWVEEYRQYARLQPRRLFVDDDFLVPLHQCFHKRLHWGNSLAHLSDEEIGRCSSEARSSTVGQYWQSQTHTA